jgi:hypothetical protein
VRRVLNVGWSWNATVPVLLFLLLFCSSLSAMPLEELDPGREWRLKKLIISGNEHISSGELEDILSTKARPWYALWEDRPVFDPAVFASDLERLVNFY